MPRIDWKAAPEFIQRLPLAHRRLIASQCDGDWRRCTLDSDGGITIHNRPQITRTELAPTGQTAKVLRRAGVAVPTPPRAPLKRVELVDDRPSREKVVIPRALTKIPEKPQPEPVPDLVLPPDPVRSTTPPPAPVAFSDPEPESLLAWSSDKSQRPDAPRVIRVLPGKVSTGRGILDDPADEALWRDENGWEMTVGYVHERCKNGLPDICDLHVHPDVLALYGVDLAMAESVVRNPAHVVIAPETFEKKYPVLRFRRGDLMAVVGFKHPRTPAMIAVYVDALLMPDDSKPQRMGGAGGGGSRKRQGVPTRPTMLLKALKELGATLEIDVDKQRATVKFADQDLGQVEIADTVSKETVESSYQRMQRKIHAIQARSA